jgi:D-alanyl-D-alanine carboxypeptidase-like protein
MFWVNPSRCYPSCGINPSELVTLTPKGELFEGSCDCPVEPGDCTASCCPRVARSAQPAFTALIAALAATGRKAGITSAFRDYAQQKCVFNEYINEKGRAARPGHSEHELGLAVDVDTDGVGYAWLAAHAHEFGFALSFPEGKQKLTGFRPEPWHVRYVGSRVASALRAEGLTPEEYFRQHPGEATSGDCSLCPDPISTPPCNAATVGGACLPGASGTSLLSFCYEDGVSADDARYLAEVDCAVTGARCLVDAEGARCSLPGE